VTRKRRNEEKFKLASSDDKKEIKPDLEKLMDWEQTAQLTWAVVLLTATLGVAGLLIGYSFAKGTLLFVIILALWLMVVIDVSVYRVFVSVAMLLTYTEQLKVYSTTFKKEMVDTLFTKRYRWFLSSTEEKIEQNTYRRYFLRKGRTVLLMVPVDSFIIAYIGIVLILRV
jgi:ABC-type transport system involved in multi-copper enzyme maturation permease subunit